MRWLVIITLTGCIYEAPALHAGGGGDGDSGQSGAGDATSGDQLTPHGDPLAGDPWLGDLDSGDPGSGGDWSGGDPSGDPVSGDPGFGDPTLGDDDLGDADPGDLGNGDSVGSGDPDLGDPDFGDPEPVDDGGSGDPEPSDPEPVDDGGPGDPDSGDEPGTMADASTLGPIIRVNEVYAHADDWLELYNAGTAPADLFGWTITDSSNNTFTFNQTTILAADRFLVLCELNMSAPWCTNAPRFDFGIGLEGDLILLEDAGNQIVDQVGWANNWGDGNSGGRIPDGTGFFDHTTGLTPTPGAPNQY